MRWIGADIYFAKDCLGPKNIQNTTIYSKFSTGTREARAWIGADIYFAKEEDVS